MALRCVRALRCEAAPARTVARGEAGALACTEAQPVPRRSRDPGDPRREALRFRRIQRQYCALIGPHDRSERALLERRREGSRRQIARPSDAFTPSVSASVFGRDGDVRVTRSTISLTTASGRNPSTLEATRLPIPCRVPLASWRLPRSLRTTDALAVCPLEANSERCGLKNRCARRLR